MSSGNQFERLFKLWATVAKLVVDGKRSVTKVANVLQNIVDVDETEFKLHFHPDACPRKTIAGSEFRTYLERTGLIDHAFSPDDKLVRNWTNNQTTYPEEFKSKSIFLWKSVRSRGSRGSVVACLLWCEKHSWSRGGHLAMHWVPLTSSIGSNEPILLKNFKF